MIYNLKQCLVEVWLCLDICNQHLFSLGVGIYHLELRQIDTTVNLLRNDFVPFALTTTTEIWFYFYYTVVSIIIPEETSLNALDLINSREG